MKKIMCILLICWLPFSIAAAQLMSAQMMLENQVSQGHQSQLSRAGESKSCHEDMLRKYSNSKQCADCAQCELATANATIDIFDGFTILEKSPAKYLAVSAPLASIQLPPTTKPPISD